MKSLEKLRELAKSLEKYQGATLASQGIDTVLDSGTGSVYMSENKKIDKSEDESVEKLRMLNLSFDQAKDE